LVAFQLTINSAQAKCPFFSLRAGTRHCSYIFPILQRS